MDNMHRYASNMVDGALEIWVEQVSGCAGLSKFKTSDGESSVVSSQEKGGTRRKFDTVEQAFLAQREGLGILV